MLSIRLASSGREIVLWPVGPTSDWIRVPMGAAVAVTPLLFWGGFVLLAVETLGGLALAAAGVWGVLRASTRGPQWLALAAGAWLVLWPSILEPQAVAAPWIGILLGLVGALFAVIRLTDRPGKGTRLGQRGRAEMRGGAAHKRVALPFNPR